MTSFTPAIAQQKYLRVALIGPSGSGKTYTALALATFLAKGQKIAVIDSERGSAAKYAGEELRCDGGGGIKLEFDSCNLGDFRYETYMHKLQEAGNAGYGVCVVDSLTHGWEELVSRNDKIAQAKYRGNTWSAWSETKPIQKRLIQCLLDYPGHVICTVRAKTQWEITEDRGKKRPQKIGLQADAQKDLDYEFDCVFRMQDGGACVVDKTRCPELVSYTGNQPGAKLAKILEDWAAPGGYGKPTRLPKRSIKSTEWDRLMAEARPVIAQFPTTQQSELYAWIEANTGNVEFLRQAIPKIARRFETFQAELRAAQGPAPAPEQGEPATVPELSEEELKELG